MNKTTFAGIILLFLISYQAVSQTAYFEGKITYDFEIKPKVANLNRKVLEKFIGSGYTLSFKEGNYLLKFKGGLIEYILYNREENKEYTKKVNNDTVYWTDCSKMGKELLNMTVSPRKEKILNTYCDQLIVEYKGESHVNYFNADLAPIDPAWFEQFKKDGEYLIDQKTRSIFLKSITEFQHFSLINTAVSIARGPIALNIFNVPGNVILVERL